MSPPWGSQKLFQRLVSHELTAYLSNFYHFFESMSIVSKSCKPGNFESHNSLKLRFCSNFLGCKSFLELNSPDFCKGRISRKPSGFLFSWLAGWLYFNLTYFFFFYRLPSTFLSTVFYAISSHIYEVLSINPSANVFVFEEFHNVHHKDWLTYAGGNDRPGELCFNFSIMNNLIQMVNFPIWIPDCDSHSPALLGLFTSIGISISFKVVVPPLGNSGHVIISLSFHQLSFKLRMGCAFSSNSLWLLSCFLVWSSQSIERCSIGGYP